jgi:signal transduction histidine kinase
MNRNIKKKSFLHTLVKEVPFGLIAINNEGVVILINPSAMSALGLESSEHFYLDTVILSFLTNLKLKNRIKSCLNDGMTSFKLRALRIKDKYLNITAKKLFDGLIINIVDVTESILMRDQATQALLLGQETERRRIAKEIHDGIGPSLSTLKLQIENVNMKIEDPDIKSKLTNVNSLISEVATEIREISHALMPSSLIDFGLVTALGNLVKRLNDTENIVVRFESNLSDHTVSKELELNLYRIIQELLNNALKYAMCAEIQIQLNVLDGKIILTFYDDGIGMDKNQINKGIGINNIVTRVKSFRGVFEINSEPGHGVNCNIVIPLKRL